MKLRRLALCLCAVVLGSAFLSSPAVHAAVIGESHPAQGITAQRIAALPIKQRAAWLNYLKRSEKQQRADRAALAAERKQPGYGIPPPPEEHAHDNSMPLDKDSYWYGTVEARHIADVIVSFQTPAGGWGKNQNRSGSLRLRGQDYVPGNISNFLAKGDFDTPREPGWNYVGTLDNGATTTELRFLALVAQEMPGRDGERYRAGFMRGIRYLLSAQFPNGGWPQVWPLEGGYHDAITYNDDAVALAAELLTAVGNNDKSAYSFVRPAMRREAAIAARRAVECILATQVVANGRRTIWGQQHDALTLQPVAARNYEPAVPSTEESADLLIYLLSLPNPSPEIAAAVHAGMQFLKKAAISGYIWTGQGTPDGRKLQAQSGAGPLWARYYTADTIKPVFGDRDKSIHDDVNELSLERRNGYSWFNTEPQKALKLYETWSKAHPAQIPPEAWRDVDPNNLVLIDTHYGQVAVELAPEFAPLHVARLRALVRARFYDGQSFYRVIDGFVAQGGIGEGDEKKLAHWPPLKAEFDRPVGDDAAFTPLGSPDLFAPEVGHVNGFPAGRDAQEGRTWIVHCPGTFAFARDSAPDTAATEFYIVIGEAPRRLDRNLTAFGRVISGLQYVQKLKRGDPDVDNGVIKPGRGRDPILRVRLAADLPEKMRPHFQVLRTDSDSFADAKQKRMNPGTSFLVRLPPPVLDVCLMPVAVRRVK